MGRLSRYMQKCMYPLDGMPFVEYTLDGVARAAGQIGSEARVVFVVGHLGEQIEAYFGNDYRGIPVDYVVQASPAGTADAVRTAFEAHPEHEDAVVWLGDSYFPAVAFLRLLSLPARDAVTLYRDDSGVPYHHRVDVAGGRVVRAWHGNGSLIDAGLWKISRGVLREMAPGPDGEYRMLHAVQRFVDAGGDVGYVEGADRVHLSGIDALDDAALRRRILATRHREST